MYNNDYINFIENIIITNNDLELVFENDFAEGIKQIIINNLKNYKISPLKCFNCKKGVIFICFNIHNMYNSNLFKNEINKENKEYEYYWTEISNNYLKILIRHIEKQLVELLFVWKSENEFKYRENTFALIYSKYIRKVSGGNFITKNLNNILINKLYNELNEKLI